MINLGIFVDIPNQFAMLNRQRIDYEKYLKLAVRECELLTQVHTHIRMANAYGAQTNDESIGFIHKLKQFGYMPKFIGVDNLDGYERTVDLAVDIALFYASFDVIVIGSNSWELENLIEFLQKNGIIVMIVTPKPVLFTNSVKPITYVDITQSRFDIYHAS